MYGKLLREVVGDADVGQPEPRALVEVPDETTGRLRRVPLDAVDRAIDDVLDSVTNES